MGAPPPYPAHDPGQPAGLPGQPTVYQPSPGQPVVWKLSSVIQKAVFNRYRTLRMTCPTCQQSIQTTIERQIGLFTWMAVGIIFLVGMGFPLLWLGCCFIPMCIPSCKDVRHTCPNCQTHLGTYQIAR
uniref:LITAF domain-containing protein n=1 Tax=Branchiostoma floridae TaxID=7739 RepID=C3Z4L2_BRAFL|eukprot:XP_002596506.1 hypothetical protein BRAFLDRAFT_211720 [Branchiostoma floridae]